MTTLSNPGPAPRVARAWNRGRRGSAASGSSRAAWRLATPLLLAALPLALFFAFFHASTLDIGNPGWLIRASDNGENALGAHAYWHDPNAGASLRTGLLNAPDGVPVLYTDSNPLLTLAAKPFARALPADAQLIGPFVLFSLFLQAVFAWLLLRRRAPGPVALWVGVALLAFPPTLFNRFIHVNLMAHWTILAALYLFLDAKRGERMRWWVPLIAITALIHSYLLVMVGAIWASVMLVRLLDGGPRTRIATLVQGTAMLALVALLAWWLGVGDQIAARNFGFYSMPLDALWNPGIQTYSNLLPAHEPTPARYFEGFQYLGAGGLALIATAIAVAGALPAAAGEDVVRQRLRRLVPALLVLGILAITRMQLPVFLQVGLDPVRASGRLFWPIGYVMVFVALLSIYRLSAERAALLLVAVLALQVADLSNMAAAIRLQSAEADRHRLYVRTLDPRWAPLIASAGSIAFIPGDVTKDLGLFQEVAWRAVKAGRPVGNVYAARGSRATIRRLTAERAAFGRGELVPGRLYIVGPTVTVPAGAAGRRLTLDGTTVVVPMAVRTAVANDAKMPVAASRPAPL
ncbi:DUF6311 domain-containing protein [Sphingomonas sp. A2-49]|uniref:DUF6311 domain-containing protein n=1 Tax=Sphingomonas sp. A2-49 TaxID=1391375 RepID=UPI0021CF93C3|nr:DUF6311 domain-containing protein [Sphingomonas sp. A2-49]MCU6454046.1 DUF6311 domain-containing protein [Sphingomonas sp. A2-49]